MVRAARIACLSLILAGCAAGSTGRDSGANQPSATPFLDDVESFLIRSEASGREYSISVALPYDYADSAKTYPVLFALDANGQFGTVVESARMLRYGEQIPQLVIVGVGYPYGGRQLNAAPHRIIDFFPVLEHEWIETLRSGWPEPIPTYDTGHAGDFLAFFREELIPLIEAEYRVRTTDRAIYGHSGGGWFSLYALLQGGGTFHRAIVGSPSLWWGNNLMFDLEAQYAEAHSTLPARMFLSIGADEANTSFADIECLCMTVNVEKLKGVLKDREYDGLEWTAHVFAEENHTSVIPATISRGLRFIYGRS